MKVVCEREILASLVEFKHHSMAEMIQSEKEEKKTKAEVPGLTKKDKKIPNFKPPYLHNQCRSGADFLTVWSRSKSCKKFQLRPGSGYGDN